MPKKDNSEALTDRMIGANQFKKAQDYLSKVIEAAEFLGETDSPSPHDSGLNLSLPQQPSCLETLSNNKGLHWRPQGKDYSAPDIAYLMEKEEEETLVELGF